MAQARCPQHHLVRAFLPGREAAFGKPAIDHYSRNRTNPRSFGAPGYLGIPHVGVGIPEEKQTHVFEHFYRAHTGTPYDFGGMRVGLYISNEIVKRHGGRMWFESEEGKGSTFYFTLPLV